MATDSKEKEFGELINSLNTPSLFTWQKVKILQNIQVAWEELKEADVREKLNNNQLFSALADVLIEKFNNWKEGLPEWITSLIENAWPYASAPCVYLVDHIGKLIEACKKYVLGEHWDVLHFFIYIVDIREAKHLLLSENELYNKVKSAIKTETYVAYYFYNITGGFDDWQLKILQDKEFIKELMEALATNDDIWDIFVNLSHHPDAKILMPKELLKKANESIYYRCVDICALLCNEEDLNSLHLDNKWIEHIAGLLKDLLVDGNAYAHETTFVLADFVLPIANLSVADSKKEVLGKAVIPSLMKIIAADELPEKATITETLERGRQEASRALWNFAYMESNRKLIAESNGGIEKLKKVEEETTDAILKKNIDGILRMFSNPPESVKQKTTETVGRHVMISYNWGNQPIVKRIAKSLQERGVKVWLDVEQMAGSTLEAMAHAVEQSEVVLMCMSQKYKDSPNCRLEGEYCVNRKVKFIPLMMQQGYAPDGWLGIALGAKLYYDFTHENDWDSKMDDLVKAIGGSVKEATRLQANNNNNNNTTNDTTPHVQHGHSKHKKPVIEWNDEDILEWMTKENISQHYNKFQQQKITGRALVEFKRLHHPHPPPFFLQFCEQLGISTVGETLEFSAALHKL